jgi:DNA-directed RNA polymerase subunit N (RpoN/RPB10)
MHFFEAVKEAYNKAYLAEHDQISIENIDLKKDIDLRYGFILDALDIKTMCCRVSVLSYTNHDTLYD